MRHLLFIPLMLLASSAGAQSTPSFAIGVDLGPAIPLGEFADDGANVGWAAGATGTVRLTRMFGLYASFERASFGVDETTENHTDGTWTDTGIGAGVRLWFPVREGTRFHPWAQLGMGWHETDAPIAGPQFEAVDTDGFRTFEGGAGVDIALLGQGVLVRPTVRYRRYGFEVESETERWETSVSSLTIALGLVFVFNSGAREDPGALRH